MATQGQIEARVKRYLLDVPADTSTEIPAWIDNVIRRAQEHHNFRFMEASAQLTTTTLVRKLGDKPTDWKEARAFPYIDENDGDTIPIAVLPGLESSIRIYDENTSTDKGKPQHILELETEFSVFPFPDALSDWPDKEYRITIPYWKFLPILTPGSGTNWFTDNAEDFVVFAAVGEGFAFNFNEGRHQFWGMTFDPRTNKPIGKAAIELTRLIRKDKLSRIPRDLTLKPKRDVRASFLQRRM